jgi:hypothetical protein
MTFAEIFTYSLPFITLFVGSLLGYWLGLRSQRIQAKRKYVADIVRDKYPALSSEIIKNMELFDDYLEDPLEHFNFPKLNQFYDDGLNEFMKKHHSNLFDNIDFLKQKIAPRLHELRHAVNESIKNIYNNWDSELQKILPKKITEKSKEISADLIRSITPNYVLKDLLNDRKDVIRKKVEACIKNHTDHFYQPSAFYPPGQKIEEVNYDIVFDSLLETARPEFSRILELYAELQKEIDEKVKSELLPLLHKFISNPYE